jgi:hypothetical protein
MHHLHLAQYNYNLFSLDTIHNNSLYLQSENTLLVKEQRVIDPDETRDVLQRCNLHTTATLVSI